MEFVKGPFARGVAAGTLLALVGLRIQALLAAKNGKVVAQEGGAAAGVVGAGAGAGAGAPQVADAGAVSTTNSGTVAAASGGTAINVYETSTAVSEYLLFHYGTASDMLPYPVGPHEALEFPRRTAALCFDMCRKHGVSTGRALDVGCAVGGAAFHLARDFAAVVGIDFSNAFVDASNHMKHEGRAPYTLTISGQITESRVAEVPSDVNRSRCTFLQGDACNLSESLGQFNVVHAVNLLCRLPNPRAFLDRLVTLVAPGGLVVLISPYSWLPGYTSPDKWIGARVVDGKPVYSRSAVIEIMSPNFKLVHEEDVPFLIREHARKFQWGCSHGSVWQKL